MQTRILKIILYLIFQVTSVCCDSQNFNPYYNFKQLNVQNGLVQNIVYHFLQDSRGYIWLGTRNGITLFDGIRSIKFQHSDNDKNSLTGNFITRILEDFQHTVWIGNNTGIDRFNQADNSFTHFGIPSTDGHKENTYCVLLGFANAHDLWFIDVNTKAIRIFNTDTKTFRFVISTDAVDGVMYSDPARGIVHIWSYLSMSTTHFVFKTDSLISRQSYFDGDKKSGLPSLLIFHVHFQNDSVAWLSTARGLIDLNPKTGKYTLYNNLNNEPVNEIRFISESPNGLLWIGTGNAGIYTFDPRQKKFVDHFRNETLDPFSICSDNIISIYFDRVGNVWCGSYGKGVSYAHVENNFFSKHLSKSEMDHWKKENNISWLGPDLQGNTWCMIQDVGGFWRLDSSLKPTAYRQPLLGNGKPFIAAVYHMLFEGKSLAWCTTDRGLFLYNTVTNRIRQVEYPRLSSTLFGSYWSKEIIRLKDSSILFSTFGGLYHITMNNGIETIQPFSAFSHYPVKSFDMLYEDSGRQIYVKDIEDSLYIISPPKNGSDYEIKKRLAFPPEIFQFQETGPFIYLATNGGLFLLDKNNLTMEKSPVNRLLPFTSIKNLLVEGNNIWLFGEKGLYLYHTTNQTGRLFSIEDGLPDNEFKEYTSLYTRSGNCIVGTNNGILSFYPETLKDEVYPPRAQLINMYVNDSSTGFIANPQECSKVILEHDQNTFSFDYSCISFQHVQESAYEYKLDGFDENWIRGGNTNYTRYSRIGPGNYTFRIRTIDAKGKISPYMKTLSIQIKKAFWQTTIFRIIMIAIAGLLIWLFVKWYLNIRIRKQQVEFEKLQAIEKERTRIATDMHDDLGAGLSRIKFLSETIEMKKQLEQPIESDVSSIGNYANEMIGKMGEIVWALNEKNDSLSDLLSYTRAYAVEYLLNNGINCQVNAPAVFPSIFVSGEFRRNIYLTIKEALHNIVKHANAMHVVVSIEIDHILRIRIHDDGGGFDRRNIRPFSNGLNNMQKRMKDISGRLEIFHDQGTVIILTAPLQI
ncbi:MAG TPA: two-component regulator propeller domain-containing protein [Puia sp.]|nr:two-component regulator propeller domain-containing protein [Puia sp.]